MVWRQCLALVMNGRWDTPWEAKSLCFAFVVFAAFELSFALVFFCELRLSLAFVVLAAICSRMNFCHQIEEFAARVNNVFTCLRGSCSGSELTLLGAVGCVEP